MGRYIAPIALFLAVTALFWYRILKEKPQKIRIVSRDYCWATAIGLITILPAFVILLTLGEKMGLPPFAEYRFAAFRIAFAAFIDFPPLVAMCIRERERLGLVKK